MKLIDDNIKTIIDQVGTPMYDFEGKTVLITGACGFLGSWFIAVFEHMNRNKFSSPARIIAVDSFIATDKQNMVVDVVDDTVEFKVMDVSSQAFVDYLEALESPVDYIIHAAGIASPIYYRKFPVETIDGMVLGLSHLLKYATRHQIRSFLYFSSSEMYGNPTPEQVPTKETYYGNVSCIGPRSCYDESKRMGEAMCVAYNRIHNIPVKWVRPFNVYGPGMRVKDDRVVPKFMYQALKKEALTVHVPGVQTRTFCYVTDAMVGFFKAFLIGKNGDVYNIGHSDPELTINDVAAKINALFNNELEVNEIEMPTEYPQDQAQRRCPDLSKAKTDLLYSPKITIDQGLDMMLQWCKTQL